MLSSTQVIAILGFTSIASAHMIMTSPVPYGKSSLNNSPLEATGADFPCKLRTGAFELEGANNVMALGSSNPLAFQGSAVHGGGSCQVSIAYTQTPDATTTFKVIHSIEGGCPMKGVDGNNGNSADTVDPSTYSFSIPADIPTGNATIAWTWFNKIGNREMYMNCAPVTLTTGSSKRDLELETRDTAAFDALPDMFKANIANGCATVDSKDVLFPNPGQSVEQDGQQTASALAAPTGSCGSSVAGGSATAGGSGSSPTSVAPVASSAVVSSPVVTSVAQVSPVASSAAGVFITAPQASAPTSAVVATSVATSIAPAASATGTTSGTTGVQQTAGSACSTEGAWNCMGTSFQRCASGTWSVVMQMAAGTECTVGSAMEIKAIAKAKRSPSVRFSKEHVRRHLHARSN